jgi:2,4-dienoyl-CoA reductase (NADPH2)
MTFEKLMEPGYIGSLRIKNRIIKTAAGTGYDSDGNPTDRQAAFYGSLAKGGVGLIITESCGIEWPRGTHSIVGGFRFHDDNLIPFHSRMVDEIHKYDCPIFIQFVHAGPWLVKYEGMGSPERIAVSRIEEDELPSDAWVPCKEMTVSEIHSLVEVFGKGALRAKKAGYDGVEFNGSYYHLVSMFLSRFWNRRHDEYGCDSLENRTRFYCEAIGEAKRLCGKDYPIATNINATEFGLADGMTLDEAKGIVPFLERAGADLIQVRVTGYGDYMSMLFPEHILIPDPLKNLDLRPLDISRGGRGILVPLASAIRQQVKVPVACAGRLDPILGEELLRQGKLDFIGMTRRLIADPELPNKVAAGRLQDIVPCGGCGYCVHSRLGDNPLKCRMNPAVGREQEYEIKPAYTTGSAYAAGPEEKTKRVLVVGGGLAGMEAARVAALRGHEVTLWEKAHKLGGCVLIAAVVKGRELDSLVDVVRYYERQLTTAGVSVKLGMTADIPAIRRFKPDAVILSTGGLAISPNIPGINHPKVIRSENLHHTLKNALRILGPKKLEKLTQFWMPLGKRVIIVGAGIQGCQLAHFLAVRGRKVTIVDEAQSLGDGLPYQTPARYGKWFGQEGVNLFLGATYEKITDDGLVIRNSEGVQKVLEADSIVITLPLIPDHGLYETLKKEMNAVYHIGDCRYFGLMHGAIADGAEIGRMI